MKYFIWRILVLCIILAGCHKNETAPFRLRTNRLSIEHGADAGADSVSLTASVAWQILHVPSWLKVSPKKGATGTHVIYFYFDANLLTDTLVANLIISAKDHSDSTVLHIRQDGSKGSVSADKLNLTINAYGDPDSVTLVANEPFTLTASAGWIQPATLSGQGGTSKIMLQFSENNTQAVRDGTLQIQPQNGNSFSVNIHQDAPYYISDFTPSSLTQGKGGTITLDGQFDGNKRPVVLINSVVATVLSFSNSNIVVTVPTTALTGRFVVQYGQHQVISAGLLAVSGSSHWQKVAGASISGLHSCTSFVYGNKMFLGWGKDPSDQAVSTFQIFDPSKNQVSEFGNTPPSVVPRYGASAFVIQYNGKDRVYLGLGSDQTGKLLKDWWEWQTDVSSPSNWTRAADLPPGGAGSIDFVINNKAYLGVALSNPNLIAFDPLGATAWIVVPLQLPQVTYAACFSIGNKGYICGGNKQGTASSACYAFNQYTGTMSRLSSLPDPISGGGGFSVGGSGYVLSNGPKSTLYNFDPVSGTWTSLYSGPTDNGEFYCSEINGVVYAWNAIDGNIYQLIF